MKVLQKIFDILGKLIALVWLLNFVVWVTNAQWHYLSNVALAEKIVNGIFAYGSFLLVAVVGFEAVARRHLAIKIIFLVLLVFCIIMMFFKGVSSTIFGIF